MNKIMYNDNFENEDFIDIELINYGFGCFTTIKLCNKKLFLLKNHFERLKSDSQKIGLKFELSIEEFIKKCYKFVEFNNLKSGAIRFNIIDTGYYCVYRNQTYDFRNFVKIKIASNLRNHTSKLVDVKSNNYLENLLSIKEARKSGFDEVLYFNFNKQICECATANIFLVNKNKIYTPDKKCGLLNGIIRRWILKSDFNVIECNLYRKDLEKAEEVFISNCLRGVMVVSKVDELVFKEGPMYFRLKNYIKSVEKNNLY
ncbi:MAG: aminotransferase class IV [Clostridiales bacterium]